MVSERTMDRLSERYRKAGERMSKRWHPVRLMHDVADAGGRWRANGRRRDEEEEDRRRRVRGLSSR